jgi:hypothetical protein
MRVRTRVVRAHLPKLSPQTSSGNERGVSLFVALMLWKCSILDKFIQASSAVFAEQSVIEAARGPLPKPPGGRAHAAFVCCVFAPRRTRLTSVNKIKNPSCPHTHAGRLFMRNILFICSYAPASQFSLETTIPTPHTTTTTRRTSIKIKEGRIEKSCKDESQGDRDDGRDDGKRQQRRRGAAPAFAARAAPPTLSLLLGLHLRRTEVRPTVQHVPNGRLCCHCFLRRQRKGGARQRGERQHIQQHNVGTSISDGSPSSYARASAHAHRRNKNAPGPCFCSGKLAPAAA